MLSESLIIVYSFVFFAFRPIRSFWSETSLSFLVVSRGKLKKQLLDQRWADSSTLIRRPFRTNA